MTVTFKKATWSDEYCRRYEVYADGVHIGWTLSNADGTRWTVHYVRRDGTVGVRFDQATRTDAVNQMLASVLGIYR